MIDDSIAGYSLTFHWNHESPCLPYESLTSIYELLFCVEVFPRLRMKLHYGQKCLYYGQKCHNDNIFISN